MMSSTFKSSSSMLLVMTLLLLYNIIPILSIKTPVRPIFNVFSQSSLAVSSLLIEPVKSTIPPSLPWTESIQPSKVLSYMPMLQNQLNVMKNHKIERTSTPEKFAYKLSDLKPARISSMTFKSSVFRKIRLTYFDGGDNVQVLNSLWYPDYKYDIPLMGLDFISLGKNRVLTVMDLQPLFPTTEYSDKYIAPLKTIRDKFPDLHGTLSGKFYDDTSFFSKQMLFGRFTDESKLHDVVEPAMMSYLEYYLKLAENAKPNNSAEAIKSVSDRQKAYDIYSSAKDPACGLFDAYFGKEWSSSFVHEFLFDLSYDPEANYAAPIHNFKVSS